MEGKRTIIIETVNHTKKTIQVDPGITGYQLKQYIFNNVSQSLGIHQMNVYYAGVKIQNSDLLSRFKKVFGQTMVVLQEKTSLSQIPGLILAYEPDPISQELETARMPCGHVIGKNCMTQFIRSLVQSHRFKIICPSFKPNSERCQVQWDYSLCKKIGVFTLEEMQEFQVGLSQNYMREQFTECPYCHVNLYRQNLTTIRVRCPKCSNEDFCSNCLLPWNSGNSEACGNAACKANQDLLNNSPQDRKFDLKEKGVTKAVFTPRYRACPNCFVPFKHEDGCKHSECKSCKTNFCWVCLHVKKKEDENWKCGGAFDYCGSVAPTQILP